MGIRKIVIKRCVDSNGEKRQANSWIKKFVLSHDFLWKSPSAWEDVSAKGTFLS